MDSLKIAVFHDAFLYRGGGERLVTLMAKALNADLISGFFSEGSFSPESLGFTGKKIPLGKPVFTKGIRHTVLKNRFKKAGKILQDYDVIILSGNCLDVIPYIAPHTKILYYCHTPPRYLFDFREIYLKKIPKVFRKITNILLDKQAKKYKSYLVKIDLIFTNSQNVFDRLEYFCGKKSTILYPPTDTSFFVPKKEKSEGYSDLTPFGEKNYYISWARLSPPKRVEMIIDAFLNTSDKNLVFTYGENDPLKEKILEKIQGKKNIFAIKSPNDDELLGLIQNAIASIYIPIDEDFGMSPVESMSCGIPVIGVNDGGLKETIIDGKTGYLLPKNITLLDIVNILEKCDKNNTEKMYHNCQIQAKKFSLDIFVESLKKHISKLVSSCKK